MLLAVFAVSAAVTVRWCGAMAGGMPMPGGWTMSMAWMRMPGQRWPDAFAAFVAMWVTMMVPMMLPSLAPMLLRYRRTVHAADDESLGARTAVVAAGYLAVWGGVGILVYPCGVLAGAAAMHWDVIARAVPGATGVALLVAGAAQWTPWKARRLAHCRTTPACTAGLPSDARTALRHGVDLGRHCAACCAGLMLVLLAGGVMDVRTMAVVATAISAERLAPDGVRAARTAGLLLAAAGVSTVARAAGLT
jgi:predicted metal-binding membrane protein